jgi:cation/acetate symporter
MGIQFWTFVMVGLSFTLYIVIAVRSRAANTKDFYVAGETVPPLANGLATAADWMSAASFISMAGLISFMGRDGAVYLMGWTGGYVLLALLLAPYLRKFGKFTIPSFIGDRYYSDTARVAAVFAQIFISFTYVAGQMRGVGVVFSRFLEVDIEVGVVIGMAIVLFYAVLGGMKGITYTQVAQYCVLIFAFLVPAIFIALMVTGIPVPQAAFGATVTPEFAAQANVPAGSYLLDVLDDLHRELGFAAYTGGVKSTIDVFAITLALMVGTAGLPHVIVRFFTVPKVKDARMSVGYALVFIALLYTTAPAIAAFARTNLILSVNDADYTEAPQWVKSWENSGLIAWLDKNDDGVIQYAPGKAFEGKPAYTADRGEHGQRLIENATVAESDNELYIDRDIMVLANPEIANLPAWVVGLVAAGGLAAALSTAAGLLLTISTGVAHDLIKRTFWPHIGERRELLSARIAATLAVFVAGYFGVYPPGFVAQVVAFAFGLAASSIFPMIFLGIFFRRMNKEGALAGMAAGMSFTAAYIVYFKFVAPELNTADHWWFGISPEGIGSVGMLMNFIVAGIVCMFTPAPSLKIQELVEHVRRP